MSLLGILKTDSSIENETDSVGGSGPVESGLYPSKVTMAYFEKSKGGALGLNLWLALEGGRELKQTIWVTSGDAKGNKNYYETQTGEKKYLPGFNLANSLTLLSVGKEIGDLEPEEKVVAIYNYESKSEQPTKVPVLTDLIGQDIIAGVLRQTVDKNVKGDDGRYHPTGETRDENEIDKFFRAKDKLTTAEIRGGATEAAFYQTWSDKWTGVTRNKATGAAGSNGTAKPNGAFAAAQASANAKPAQSLFAS